MPKFFPILIKKWFALACYFGPTPAGTIRTKPIDYFLDKFRFRWLSQRYWDVVLPGNTGCFCIIFFFQVQPVKDFIPNLECTIIQTFDRYSFIQNKRRHIWFVIRTVYQIGHWVFRSKEIYRGHQIREMYLHF